MVSVGWHEIYNYMKSIYAINILFIGIKQKGEVRGGFQINEKKKKTLDNQIGRDTKLSISMQSMDQIQFD